MSDLGLGLYTIPEAARLIQAPAREVRRWLKGYRFKYKTIDGKKAAAARPLWETQYADDMELHDAIGFLDLLELRIVKAFVKAGVPLSVVRRCLENARELNPSSHPLTSQAFRTDGRTIYAQSLRDQSETEFLDLRTLQYAFKEVIKPSLYAGIEYQNGQARRWFPAGASAKIVVLDPQIQFGKPVLAHSSVPTRVLYEAFKAEGGDRSASNLVSRVYEVPHKEVQAAIRFETDLLAA